MKKVMLLLISFILMLSIFGCSKLDIGEEFKSDMIDVFNKIDQKHEHFSNGDYDNWILDKETDNYIISKIIKYNYHYRQDSKEKLSKDEVFVLEAIVKLYNSYMSLQIEYQDHGDEVFNDNEFKELQKQFESSLKDIKSKIK